MTPESLLAELERRNVKVTLAGDRLRLEAPAGVLTPELKELLSAHKQELICHLMWTNMLERCNQSYRPGALKWAREHFPELEKRLVEAESRFEKAYWRQDVEAVRQAAADWEAGLRRIVSLYRMAGEVREVAANEF